MNLRELRAAHPDLFYKQEWFESEAFMDRPLTMDIPKSIIVVGAHVPSAGHYIALYPAVVLAHFYVQQPDWIQWRRCYFWTSDYDREGQQVFVGDNGKGLEVHRNLRLTDKWQVPAWEP